ncbi:protein SCAI-like [Salvia divinorum]|uniref:Protein SCAI-like n=1 Tax=Salvia divinorum TaxID=28513 RepID=A0ABD1ILU5_SALDI
MLLYLSAVGNYGHSSTSQVETNGTIKKSSLPSASAKSCHEQRNSFHENHITTKGHSNQYYENYLLLGPSRNGNTNILFHGDLIPFTRRPLFLIIDSDNSHAFKVLHGAERGEPAALFLSPLSPSFKNSSAIDSVRHGSQFTFFLSAPLLAFCQLVDYNVTEDNMNMYNRTESILSTAFSKWEQILYTSTDLDLVWAQLLSDPFLRRLILRFIFCHFVLTLFYNGEKGDQYFPICIPELRSSVSANSKVVQPATIQLADHLKVKLL